MSFVGVIAVFVSPALSIIIIRRQIKTNRNLLKFRKGRNYEIIMI